MDLEAPVNRMRASAFRATVDALYGLPAPARERILAVKILDETHYVFPSLRAGPGDAVAARDLTDYSPAMKAGFRAWLRGRLGTVEALNASLAGRYASFDAVAPPTANGASSRWTRGCSTSTATHREG